MIAKFLIKSLKFKKEGVAALPTLLILGGIIVNTVIIIVLGVYLLIGSGFGNKLSSEALAAAKAGIQDGILKVARDKNFSGSYEFAVGQRSVSIEICKDLDSPICVGQGRRKISAIGSALTRRRKLEAVLSVSSLGEVKLESVKETAL